MKTTQKNGRSFELQSFSAQMLIRLWLIMTSRVYKWEFFMDLTLGSLASCVSVLSEQFPPWDIHVTFCSIPELLK